jgi:hypothetical protein
MVRAILMLSLLAVVCAGCGGGSKPACVINAAGAKLCGGDAKAYCQKFEQGTNDPDTLQACAAVGARVEPAPVSSSDPLVETFTEDCVRAGGDRTQCGVAADEAKRAGIETFDVRMKDCVSAGHDPFACVSSIE